MKKLLLSLSVMLMAIYGCKDSGIKTPQKYEATDSVAGITIHYSTSKEVPDSIRVTIKKALGNYKRILGVPITKDYYVIDTFIDQTHADPGKKSTGDTVIEGGKIYIAEKKNMIAAKGFSQTLRLNTFAFTVPGFDMNHFEMVATHEIGHSLKPGKVQPNSTPYMLKDSFSVDHYDGLVFVSTNGKRFPLIEEAMCDLFGMYVYQKQGRAYSIPAPSRQRITYLLTNMFGAGWVTPNDLANGISGNNVTGLVTLMVNKPRERLAIKDVVFIAKCFDDIYQDKETLEKSLQKIIVYRGEKVSDYVIPNDFKTLLQRKEKSVNLTVGSRGVN